MMRSAKGVPRVRDKGRAGSQNVADRQGEVFRIKRVYEPRAKHDGKRILVERLWPRGIKKEDLEAHAWMKEVAPSTALRQWFGHDVRRWDEFRQRYEKELIAHPDAWVPLLDASRRGPVTLLFSARDLEHNGAIVLRDFLVKRQRLRSAPRPARLKGDMRAPRESSSARSR